MRTGVGFHADCGCFTPENGRDLWWVSTVNYHSTRMLTVFGTGLIILRVAKHPQIRLSRLRDIGWRCWDPIGLSEIDGGWENSAAADEYDSYLMKAAGMVRRNEGDNAAAQYLVWVESEHMGMGIVPSTRSRAEATVAAIRADNQLWNEDQA